MLVNAERLIEASGISCFMPDIGDNDGDDDATIVGARMAFVTPQSVSRMERSMARVSDAAQRLKVEYGDIVMAWTSPDGRRRGRHLRCGQDAAVYVEVDTPAPAALPFTGRSMHRARTALLGRIDRGDELSKEETRIFDGISEVYDIVRARSLVDPDRFDPEIVGQAFFSAFTDISEGARVVEPADMAAFGRIGRHAMMHARLIGSGRPGSKRLHAEGSLEAFIEGMTPRAAVAGIFEMLGRKKTGMSSIQTEDRPAKLLRKISSSRLDDIEAIQMSGTLAKPVLAGLEEAMLSGGWVAAIRKQAQDLCPDARVSICATQGRDILILEKASSVSLFAWPSDKRVPVLRDGGRFEVAVSMSEAPEEAYLRALSNEIRGSDLPRPTMGAA